MAFAGRCGVTLNLDPIAFDASADEVDAFKRDGEEQLAGPHARPRARRVVRGGAGSAAQVRESDRGRVMDALRAAGVGDCAHIVGTRQYARRDPHHAQREAVFAEKRIELQRAWSDTTFRMQSLRDNPQCAQEEFDRVLDAADPGLSFALSFDPAEETAAPYCVARARGRGSRCCGSRA
jgi:phosphoribosylformylglycinamidine synthase